MALHEILGLTRDVEVLEISAPVAYVTEGLPVQRLLRDDSIDKLD